MAHDGEADVRPGADTSGVTESAGSHVVIEAEKTGTLIVIAHLQRGSVIVKKGQRLQEGMPVGRCGNSGNTSDPHIHIHHQRPGVFGDGEFAEGLPLYFRDHGGRPMPVGGWEEVDGEIVWSGDVVQHRPR